MDELLEADNISVAFGSLIAVRDVSFTVSKGQLVGLIGPNGAGKTTLLRALAGLHAPTRGTSRIMGKPVLGTDDIVRQHVGFAHDAPPAYEDLTIQQFLTFIARAYEMSPSEADECIDFWLQRLWLTDKRDSPIKQLSRGMKQRVTLARTFMPRPHVILLDEPLAGLDPAGRVQLRGVLGMLRDQGCAMIVSSHILGDLEEVSTHIAIIERGSILRFSPAAALHHQQEGRRTYRLATLKHQPQDAVLLSGIEGLTNLTHTNSTYTFDYEADDAAAADLLRRLVAANVCVVSFTRVKASLEEAYLRSGVKQVD